jgi:hypothetical protein
VAQIVIGIVIGVLGTVLGRSIFLFLSPPLERFRDTLYLRIPKEPKKAKVDVESAVEAQTNPEEKVRIEVLGGILYKGRKSYKKGERLEVSAYEADSLARSGLIKRV